MSLNVEKFKETVKAITPKVSKSVKDTYNATSKEVKEFAKSVKEMGIEKLNSDEFQQFSKKVKEQAPDISQEKISEKKDMLVEQAKNLAKSAKKFADENFNSEKMQAYSEKINNFKDNIIQEIEKNIK